LPDEVDLADLLGLFAVLRYQGRMADVGEWCGWLREADEAAARDAALKGIM